MKVSFLDLFNTITEKHDVAGEQGYRLVDLEEVLQKNNAESISIDDDYIVLPFYISESTLEVYWYQLTINLADKPCFEEYICKKVGVASIESIDKEILGRSKKIYLEAIKPEATISMSQLLSYVNYVKNSEELVDEITEVFSRYVKDFKFNVNNIYITIY